MKALIWGAGILALLTFIIGGTIEALAFLLWASPVLLAAAVLLFILSRSGGRRIPR